MSQNAYRSNWTCSISRAVNSASDNQFVSSQKDVSRTHYQNISISKSSLVKDSISHALPGQSCVTTYESSENHDKWRDQYHEVQEEEDLGLPYKTASQEQEPETEKRKVCIK